ncbi:MAG: aminotransferase class III-fold pyridoxal phosphate-dependent enzyme [Chloroflexi bacterium]|nr:aminotransferase class III-fold pyridoxal phosphate-dependent enzyme [Chloroflexota bacterium]MYF21340.1 aminotransferase class III-fold pyridoxal phosphate-dependent enzyme [Chloroflexota bacterium]
MTTARSRTADAELRERARAVIPNGMYGHQSATYLPDNFPQFFARGEGSHLWDVDGNEYIDYLCAYGPILLGYRHPAVDQAAAGAQDNGDCFNGPSDKMVELAELLVEITPWADWAWMAKNGTDATVFAASLSRNATGRQTILRARGAYHGASPTWISGGDMALQANGTIEYEYNDLGSVRTAVETADGDAAAIIVSAFKHDVGYDQELPTVEFARGVRELCDANGIVLILDDVRGGFRIDMAGSWAPLGVDPDLSAYCKAIGNGHPISALMGRESLTEAVASTFGTGSYWFTGAPMAAAQATIETMLETDGIAHLDRIGSALRSGWQRAADSHGVGIRQTGPVSIPLMLFDGDDMSTRDVPRAYRFSSELAERGVYLHPVHNGFLSTAISEEDIAHTLEASDEAFAVVASEFPA